MIWARRHALLAMVLSTAVAGVTTLPVGQRLPWPVAVSPFVLAMLVFLFTFWKLIVEVGFGPRARRRQWRLLRETMSLRLLVASGLVYAGFLLVGVAGMSGLPEGQPQERGGVHTFNNHGAITVVTESDYLRFEARSQRLTAALAGGFSVGELVYLTALLRRRDAQKRAMTAPPAAG
jgi:hypothetical protein